MNISVTTTRSGGVAVVTIANPPRNLLTDAVNAGLLDALIDLGHDGTVLAIVLAGAGGLFSAGLDLRAAGSPEHRLATVADCIEGLGKPVVAALHGAVLGGGLELAMACHWRVAAPGARLGLPGIRVGLLPQAGGSQRLTRLVGPRRTLDMLLTGAELEAEDALALGLVDAVAHGDLVAAAVSHARSVVVRKLKLRRVSRLPVDLADIEAGLFTNRRAQVVRGAPGLFALPRCVDAVDAACMLPTAAAMDRQADLAAACRDHPQSRALVHAFFAEREAAHPPAGSTHGAFEPIRSAVLIGASAVRLADRLVDAGVAVWPDSRIGEADFVYVTGPTPPASLRGRLRDTAILGSADPGVPEHTTLALRVANLAEIVMASASQTAPAAAMLDLARRAGWTPVLHQRPGAFLTNLLNEAWRQAMAQLVDAGARADQILRACAALGFTGRPIPVRPPLAGQRGPALAMSDEAILAACVAAIAGEGRRLIADGVVRSTADIDVAAIHGLGFPRHRGGPMFAMQHPAAAPAGRP
jgi:enoyl-CoA hydratase/carnithine racemase